MSNLSLYSQRVLLPTGITEATVHIRSGSIHQIKFGKDVIDGSIFYDHGNHVIMPGLIDSHVHINEPGRTDWEGFETATKAAAAGGITTLIDMPLNSSPVTTSLDAFTIKLKAAENKCLVNCGFYGGVIPNNENQLEDLLNAGVFGLKAFLTHSGIDEFPNVTEDELIKIMPLLKKYNVPLLVHCELSEEKDLDKLFIEKPTSYKQYLASRPRSWEDNAIALVIRLCEQFNIKAHIVHVSSSDSIEQIKTAKNQGLPLTAETCPHYLYFNAEDIQDGNTLLKCAPPIREKENNDKLWSAIKEGVIDFIVSDHSPAPPALKEIDSGDFIKAWGGIASLQFSLSACWTKAREKGFDLMDISQLMSARVAKFLNLESKKGALKEGFDADILVWNPETSMKVKPDEILHRHPLTPYAGETLFGVVKQTICGGQIVYGQGREETLYKAALLYG